MFFLEYLHANPTQIQGELRTMKAAANRALYEKSVLDHQIGRSMTELITNSESFFPMKGVLCLGNC